MGFPAEARAFQQSNGGNIFCVGSFGDSVKNIPAE
jgi:hypothetical protein